MRSHRATTLSNRLHHTRVATWHRSRPLTRTIKIRKQALSRLECLSMLFSRNQWYIEIASQVLFDAESGTKGCCTSWFPFRTVPMKFLQQGRQTHGKQSKPTRACTRSTLSKADFHWDKKLIYLLGEADRSCSFSLRSAPSQPFWHLTVVNRSVRVSAVTKPETIASKQIT